MTIIGIAGAIGSGKSFTQLKHGLKYVEERQKRLMAVISRLDLPMPPCLRRGC